MTTYASFRRWPWESSIKRPIRSLARNVVPASRRKSSTKAPTGTVHGGKAEQTSRSSKQPGMAKAGLLSPGCLSRLARVASPRLRLPSADG